jgi:hypothetical protein
LLTIIHLYVLLLLVVLNRKVANKATKLHCKGTMALRTTFGVFAKALWILYGTSFDTKDEEQRNLVLKKEGIGLFLDILGKG